MQSFVCMGLHSFSELFPEKSHVGIIFTSAQMGEGDWFPHFQNRLRPQAMFNPLQQQHLLKYDDGARFFKYFISINI